MFFSPVSSRESPEATFRVPVQVRVVYFETNDFVAYHSGVNPACPESRELAEIVLA